MVYDILRIYDIYAVSSTPSWNAFDSFLFGYYKLENDIERLYEILYDFKGDDESKREHKRVLQYLLELKLHWKHLK